jgi:serine/threonine-protein kinase
MSWSRLIAMLSEAGRYREADEVVAQAEAADARVGPSALLQQDLGSLRALEGRTDEALEHRLRALELSRKEPDNEANVANDLQAVSETLVVLGRFTEALRAAEEGRAAAARVFGPKHPDLAQAVAKVADVQLALGRDEAALAGYRRNLAILDDAFGPTHVQSAEAALNVANALTSLGRYHEAEPLIARARPIIEGAFDETSVYRSGAAQVLADLRAGQHRYAEAASGYRAVIKALQKVTGGDEFYQGQARASLGAVLRDMGRFAEADQELARAIALLRKSGPVPTVDLASALTESARVALSRGRPAAALAEAEEARQIVESRLPADHLAVAGAAFASASAQLALRPGPDGRAQAVALAERALAIYAARPAQDDERKEVEAWLKRARRTGLR